LKVIVIKIYLLYVILNITRTSQHSAVVYQIWSNNQFVIQIPEVFEGFKQQYVLNLFKLGCGSWHTHTHSFYWVKVCRANVINIRVSEVTSCIDLTWNDPRVKFISEAKNMK